MQHAHTLVFVEVRYRRSTDFGGALESITPAKQQRIMQAYPPVVEGRRLCSTCSAVRSE